MQGDALIDCLAGLFEDPGWVTNTREEAETPIGHLQHESAILLLA